MANDLNKPACLTCGGSGWIGGPSFYAPDEGGEECPDCALTSPVAPEQVVAAGWKLVPMEPTEEMLRAGHDYGAYGRDNIHSWDDPRAVYLAMLAASPDGAPVAMAQFIEPVMTMHRGGSDAFGRTNVAVRWEAGANKLPDGEHKLYAWAETGAGTPVHELAFVQPVPSHCDRITWRGSYYHLPISASPEAAPAAMDEQRLVTAEEDAALRNAARSSSEVVARGRLAATPAAPSAGDEAIAAGDATLHGAIDLWQGRAARAEELADSEGTRAVEYLRRARKVEALHARLYECLVEVKDRMELSIREGATAAEAYDSFYAEMVVAALAQPAPVQAGAQQAVENQCGLCGGRGFYGTPGARCEWCKGTGKALTAPTQAGAGDAKGEKS